MALAKARLVEITAYIPREQESSEVPASADGAGIAAHFNPQTLKVSINSNNQGGNQPGGGSGKQFVGSGTSSLQVELLFDTTVERAGTARSSDVRRITEKLAKFIVPKEQPNDPTNRHAPPLARFEWGSFIFEGVIDQLDETLDYFSEEGVPLRATVALKMSRDDIAFTFAKVKSASAGAAAPGAPGTGGQQPVSEARPGESVQDMAARNGQPGDWKAIAAANGIDDPLRLQAGALVNLNAGAAAGISAGAAAGFGAAAGASAGLSAGASVGLSAGLGGGVGFSVGASAGFGASAGASAGFGASAGASAGFGASAGASAGFGASAGASAGFGASASAGAAVGAGTGLQAGVGVK
jgi:hypothetical protein